MAQSRFDHPVTVEQALQYVNVLFRMIKVSATDRERRAVARALVRLSVDPNP